MSKNQLSFQTILGMPNGSVGIFEDNLGGLSKFGKKIYGSKYYATDSGKLKKQTNYQKIQEILNSQKNNQNKVSNSADEIHPCDLTPSTATQPAQETR